MSGRSLSGAPRVLVVIGTRPEAIKLAPLVLALQARSPDVLTQVVLTGQHDALATDMLKTFRIQPDRNLKLMRPGQSLYDLGHGTMDGLRTFIKDSPPDMVVVQGDTASVFFGALVGFFEQIPVAHVEAGLRSGRMDQPFPEEGFRRLTSVLASIHFAPTQRATDALMREGIPSADIHRVGNSVVDALRWIADRNLPIENPALNRLVRDQREGLAQSWALLTTHRRESQGEPMARVFEAIRLLAEEDQLPILYPVHPNPVVRDLAEEMLGSLPNVHLVDPLSYSDLVHALGSARLILTDSGGIQEEAPTFGTPVVVLRNVTERPEAIEAGLSTLVGTDTERILAAARQILRSGRTNSNAGGVHNPFGDGYAGERMARLILSRLGIADRRGTDYLPELSGLGQETQ